MDECDDRLEKWFKLPNQRKWFTKIKVKVLADAIILVMKGNKITQGDLFSRTTQGVVMGMAPAPLLQTYSFSSLKKRIWLEKLTTISTPLTAS